MRLRTIVVWVIFGLLGLVGVGAVVSALTQRWDAILRVIGVGIIGTTGALLTIPFAMLSSRPALRMGAVAAIGVLAIEAGLLCVSIALIDISRFDEALAVLAGALALPGVLIVPACFMYPQPATRGAAITALVVVGGSILLVLPFVGAHFMGGPAWDRETSTYFYLGQVLPVAGLLWLASTWRRPEESLARGLLVGLAPALTFILTAIIAIGSLRSSVFRADRIVGGVMVGSWFVAATLSIGHLARVAGLRGNQKILRAIFLASGLLAGVLGGGGVLAREESMGALGAACAVIAACALVGIGIVWWLNRRTDVAERFSEIKSGAIECPRCRASIELRPGSGECAACGLRYKFTIEAARCRECRHELVHLVSDRCPECGETVRRPPRAAPTAV